MKIIIALGGNAILRKGENFKDLGRHVKEVCKKIKKISRGNKIIITSGNGSEIGYLLLQNELASKKVPVLGLDVLGAESQGLIGYLLERELRSLGVKAVSLFSQVLVDKKFMKPTKFIGEFYSKKEALKKDFVVKEDFPRGYRRVVASPRPLKVLGVDVIKKLSKSHIVISCVGGGVPVYYFKGKLKGLEGVIDKDLSSACLGKSLKAKILLIITDVDKVYLNYGKKNQKGISKMDVLEAKKYMNHFSEGSMKPKIEAAIDFLKVGKRVVITNIKNVEKALKGKAGTLVVR